MDILIPEFKEILLLLLSHDVRFMLIGGYSVIYYGYERSTTDMDVWLDPDNSNKEKVISALKELDLSEESISKLSNLDFSVPQVFYYGQQPKRIDFLTHIQNVHFSEAFKRSNRLPIDDKLIHVIHFDDLILSKISSDRLKDKADVEELQKINKFRKGK
jgi:predicted nucleotidyltransferase